MPEEAKGKKARKKRAKNGTALDSFPPTILVDLDRLIVSGYGAMRCLTHLTANYSDVIVPPSIGTLHEYIKKRRDIIEKDVDLRLKIQSISSSVDMTQLDPKDSMVWVEALLGLNGQLMNNNLNRNRKIGDPRFEKIVAEVSRNTASLLETKMKLEAHGKLMTSRFQAMVRILSKHLMVAIESVHKKVHGDKKLDEFSSGFDTAVKALDMDAIEEELNQAMGAKGGTRG